MSNNPYSIKPDTSIVDEFFAVFVGTTLAVSLSGWSAVNLKVVLWILTVVCFIIILAVVAINIQRSLLKWMSYFGMVAVSILGYFIIMKSSGHDLIPEKWQLLALPIGSIFWVLTRELSNLAMLFLIKWNR